MIFDIVSAVEKLFALFVLGGGSTTLSGLLFLLGVFVQNCLGRFLFVGIQALFLFILLLLLLI